MRVALLLVCVGSLDAYAQPMAVGASTASPDEPALGVEVAGTWSGKTTEPKTGWRAALLVPVEIMPGTRSSHVVVAVVGRFDNHGAPAEHGDAETHATSWGAGLRATLVTSTPFRFGAFAEGTVGRTHARHADEMTSRRAGHWMVSGGLTGGTRSVQVVADFGWMVTETGDGRIGPIASLGLHLALD